MDLRGKHVLLTGSTSGIGKQLLHDLLLRGCRVTTLDRKEQHSTDPAWIPLIADVRDAQAVAQALSTVTEPIDILINNAGVMRRGTVLEQSVEEFDELMDANVRGSWLVLRAALPCLHPSAMIVQMSSRHGMSLPVNPALYGLSKKFIMDMMEVVAKTYPQFTVKILCPGPVDTPLARAGATPEEFTAKQKMMCSAEDMSRQIVELLEADDKRRLTFDTHTYTHFLE